MSEKIFNPDTDYFGVTRQYRAKFDGMNDVNTEYSPETHCPYDKSLCRQKLAHIQRWTNAIEYMAENKVNNVIRTAADMFHKCPEPDLNCIRRLRYEYIIRDMMEREQQR